MEDAIKQVCAGDPEVIIMDGTAQQIIKIIREPVMITDWKQLAKGK